MEQNPSCFTAIPRTGIRSPSPTRPRVSHVSGARGGAQEGVDSGDHDGEVCLAWGDRERGVD